MPHKDLLEKYVEPYEPSCSVGVIFIVEWVIAIYVFSIFVWVLCLAYRGIYSNEDVFDSIAEIIKVAVVPVVTFVIGYCFGSSLEKGPGSWATPALTATTKQGLPWGTP